MSDQAKYRYVRGITNSTVAIGVAVCSYREQIQKENKCDKQGRELAAAVSAEIVIGRALLELVRCIPLGSDGSVEALALRDDYTRLKSFLADDRLVRAAVGPGGTSA